MIVNHEEGTVHYVRTQNGKRVVVRGADLGSELPAVGSVETKPAAKKSAKASPTDSTRRGSAIFMA